MAQPNAVEIVEVCMVAPPPPAATPDHSSTSPNSLPLTFFDMQWIRLTRFQRLYFYQTSKTTSFSDSILPRLKHSLSLTLLHYFPLAGNITWPPTSPKPVVVFAQGDAVSVTVAKSNADFYLLSGCEGNELWDATEYHHLLPKLAVSHEQAQVLTIQITFFPESGGFSIGIVANHGVVDGKSLAMFTKSWAHICRSLSSRGGDEYSDQSPLLQPELKPLYDRTLIEEPAKLQAIFSSNQWLNRSVLPLEQNDAPDSVRGTFRFSRANIEELRRLVLTVNQDECAHDRCRRLPVVRHLSAFSLTCAYTWVCLVKAEGINDDNIVLVFPVECRFRLDPPIAVSYFGNCSGIKFVVAEREALLGTEGFVVAVNAISEAIRSLENNINGVLSESENQVLSVILSKSSDSQSGDAAAPERRVYSAIESNRFDVYGTDFGWGRPKKVEMATGDGTGAMNFADSRDGDGGVEIGIVLKKQHMETFASLFAQGLEEKTA